MKDHTLNLKFFRIITGYYNIRINSTDYKIIYPNHEIKYAAERLYVSFMENSKFDTEYLKTAELNDILSSEHIWNEDKEKNLKEVQEHIDKLKMRLCEYWNKKKIRSEAHAEIRMLKEYFYEMNTQKHSLDYLTLDFFANNIKNEYIISQCILYEDNQNVFESNYQDIEVEELKPFLLEINRHQITGEELRAICKGDEWRRYSNSDNIFGPTINLNDDQNNLLALQRMYDNVRQHPECPEDDLIDDSDALDGWFLIQKDKAQKNKKKTEALEKIRGKVGSHDFQYIMTRDMDEAEAIEEMNDFRGRQLVDAVRAATPNDGDTMKWSQVPFIKQELQSEAYRNQKQGVPNK